MTGRVQDRIAIVIGAARGIGAGIAERLAEEGARVVIGDTRADLGEATARRLGGSFVRCNVAEPPEVQAIVDHAVHAHGRLDIMVQNAGIFPMHDLVDIPVDEWDQVLAVNLRGCFLATQAALRVMRPNRYGRIVLTSSITGPRVVPPQHAHYAASKAGINGLIRAAALKNAAMGITVNGVEPGNILTEAIRTERSPEYIAEMAASIPMGELGTPRDIGNAVLFLASDEARYITGTTIIVDGGQLLPEGKVLSERVPFLRVENVSKRFGAVQALDGVSFDIFPGEVVALLGDNGAGKSTLIKIISGTFGPSSGRLLFDGIPTELAGPADAKALGVETVYQDLSLCPNVDTVANFFMGRERIKRVLGLPFLDEAAMQAETEQALRDLGTRIPDVRTTVEHLSGGQRQAIELCRFVHWGGKLVLLDEPFAALGVEQTRRGLEMIRRISAQGVAVLVITHNVLHAFHVADRAVIMRQGRVAGERRLGAATAEEIVALITGELAA